MISGSVARRYAKALMMLGLERGSYERLGKELRTLAKAIKGSPELAQTLSNPAFPRADREKGHRRSSVRSSAGLLSIAYV